MKKNREERVSWAYATTFAVMFLALFIFLAVSVVQNNYIINTDNFVSNWLSENRTESGIKIFNIITDILSVEVLVIALIILAGYFYYKKRHNSSLLITLSIGFGLIMRELLSFTIQRERPLNALSQVAGFSFPSGHTLTATIFFILICVLLWKKANIASKLFLFISSLILILLAGFARIYLNVHYLSDVLAGFALGVFSVCISSILTRYIK